MDTLPVVMMVFFFLLFIAAVVWAVVTRKSYMDRMSNLPLDSSSVNTNNEE